MIFFAQYIVLSKPEKNKVVAKLSQFGAADNPSPRRTLFFEEMPQLTPTTSFIKTLIFLTSR